MMDKEYRYKCLYNALYLLTSTSDERKMLSKRYPNFDFYDELENMLDLSMHDFFVHEMVLDNKIDAETENELKRLYSYIMKIDTIPWNDSDFENHDDWKLVRQGAQHLFTKLNFKRSGLDYSDERTVFNSDM